MKFRVCSTANGSVGLASLAVERKMVTVSLKALARAKSSASSLLKSATAMALGSSMEPPGA